MLERTLKKLDGTTYAILRVVSGLLFAFHGAEKIFGIFGAEVAPFRSQMWFGGLIELIGGLMIAGGILTFWAAFIASGTMAVAYIQFHWKGAFDSRFFPRINRGELAVIYSFLFLYIACRGPGRWSFDKR